MSVSSNMSYIKLSVAYLIIMLASCTDKPSKKEDIIIIPKALKVVSVGKPISLDEWMSNCYKVIIYKKMLQEDFYDPTNWNENIKKYPNVKFIFLIDAKEERLVKHYMKMKELSDFSVYWDKESQFLPANNLQSEITFISYIVDKNNKVIKLSNPSLANFEETLNNLEDCQTHSGI